MRKMFDSICESLESGDQSKMQIFLYTLLAVISGGMTVLNVITDKGLLTYVTGAFALLSLCNILLTNMKGVFESIALFLFSLQLVGMFTVFLITGNPDGFSVIWICMLPSGALFFFKRKFGSVVCAMMFAILVFFLWTSTGSKMLMYDYGTTFCTRFPILFVAFFAISFFLASITEGSLQRTVEARARYQKLSTHDMLTGLLNRQGLYSKTANLTEYSDIVGFAMIDIDYFKSVNDRYGHKAGDIVLKGLSEYLSRNFNAILCRWGGEEFVAIYQPYKVSHHDLEILKNGVAQRNFLSDLIPEAESITISIGVYEPLDRSEQNSIDACINKADEALYHAKNSGRNAIVYYNELN